MVNVGSLPDAAKVVFDLDTQAGVMHLLASVRASEISPIQKSELRDLVFLYTNGGKDLSVRLSLEQKIAANHITPVPVKVVAQPLPPPPTIGKFRVAPSFVVPPAGTQANEKVDIPVATFVDNSAWKPAPVVEPPAAAAIPETLPVESTSSSAPVQPVVVEPVPVAIKESAAFTVPTDDQQYLQRIREIKALVNEKVGNPVNLVDINNEVGREYMGALLDAMKKLNSGSSAGSAMKRLEDAFVSVEEALKEHEQTKSSPVVSAPPLPPSNIPDPTPTPEFVAPPEPAPLPPPVLEVEPEDEPPFVPISAPFTPPSVAAQAVHIEEDEPPFVPISAPFSPPEPMPAYVPPPVNQIPIERVPQPPIPPPVSYQAPETAPSQAAPHFASLADMERPHALDNLPTTASLKTASESGDPLFNKEVDDGLQQLLSEWSIFKKSGLFGTGPKGKEHPLFKKMAPLHIPLLLAGRFEGATQDIKQSVTDYMNGWRYEQGLIYQQGETFEHYLRRVIRHILDLQKGR